MRFANLDGHLNARSFGTRSFLERRTAQKKENEECQSDISAVIKELKEIEDDSDESRRKMHKEL